MPYNTRRKSLSLSSLGIHVPVTHAARAAAAAAAAAQRASASPKDAAAAAPGPSTSSRALSPVSMASSDTPAASAAHPRLKLKRSHADAHAGAPPAKRRDSGAANKFGNTPPPSPLADLMPLDVDDLDSAADVPAMDPIDDDIVEAVVAQLRLTGNRPHLVKELSAVLMQQLRIVQQSANPCAIISSRLATFMKRPCWSPKAPCPLAKELEPVHPRRTYFFLTTCRRQPLPDSTRAGALSRRPPTRVIITPSLSSADSRFGSEDADSDERRRELSPSPEVDLSSPELEDDADDDSLAMPSTPVGSGTPSVNGIFAWKYPFPRYLPYVAPHSRATGPVNHIHRGVSPALEKDEKEFTQTADGLQKRKLSGDLWCAPQPQPAVATRVTDGDRDGDPGLFLADKTPVTTAVGSATSTSAIGPVTITSSPPLRLSPPNFGRKDAPENPWASLDSMLGWDRSPESISLDELNRLLGDDF